MFTIDNSVDSNEKLLTLRLFSKNSKNKQTNKEKLRFLFEQTWIDM